MHCGYSWRERRSARSEAGRYGRRTLPLHDRLQRFLFRDRNPAAWIRHGLLHRRRAGAEPGRGDHRMGAVGVAGAPDAAGAARHPAGAVLHLLRLPDRSDRPVVLHRSASTVAGDRKRLSVSRGGIRRPGTCHREQGAARHRRRGALLLAVPAAVCAAADRRQPGHCRDLIDRARGRAAQRDHPLADDPRLRRRWSLPSPCRSTCRIATA